MNNTYHVPLCLLLLISSGCARNDSLPLLEEIQKIPAVDNHAHPVCPPTVVPGDRDFDALPVDNLEAESDPALLRPTNPLLPQAWKALYGFSGQAETPDGLRQLQKARDQIRKDQGVNYARWVLNQANIQTMLGNRVAFCQGIARPQFAWVPYADALLFPLNNSQLAGDNPDRKVYVPLEDKLLHRYLTSRGMPLPPATLKEYLEHVVSATLEEQRKAGAVAEKFEIAYLRGFDFADVSEESASAIYSQWIHKGPPDQAAYKALQDYIFRYIAAECGRLGMAVHLHAMAGAGGYFNVSGVNPLLLEPLINNPQFRKTRFVFVHGGWPYTRETAALLEKPNVYVDFSSQSLSLSAPTLAVTLREWLERNPEKVLFGTDAYPSSELMGWEESLWMANKTGREALAMALTAMQRNQELTTPQALHIAHQVLHDNAASIYSLQ